MSDVNQNEATPVAPQAAPVAIPPAVAPKSAIQLIEAQIAAFFQQKEKAIANLHALDGAIQGAQQTVQLLKQEAARAAAEAKKLVDEAEAGLKAAAAKVENVATEVVNGVKAEAEKV